MFGTSRGLLGLRLERVEDDAVLLRSQVRVDGQEVEGQLTEERGMRGCGWRIAAGVPDDAYEMGLVSGSVLFRLFLFPFGIGRRLMTIDV